MIACGSPAASANSVLIGAYGLPAQSFGFFLTSRTAGLTPNPGGSSGDLCLGGQIGRFVGPGQIRNSGEFGTYELPLDLTLLPTPSGLVAAQPGETWYFTSWFRDVTASGNVTSNFADRLSLVFQ